jgi:hypothetical protein
MQLSAMIEPVRIQDRNLKLHKATANATLGARTVLANSPWDFVALWLKREHHAAALFYWQQAQTFAQAARDMPVDSSPLLHYYSFMNATKALLSARGVSFTEHHGVRAHNMRGTSNKLALSNEGVRMQNHGIAPALATYLGELESVRDHSLEDLFFNIPCVHRTYCLTYKSQSDLFIPLTDCAYVYDSTSGKAYLSANLSRDYAGSKYMRRLPASLIEDTAKHDGFAIRSRDSVPLGRATITTPIDLAKMQQLQRSLRPDLNYIAGSQTLWYVKAVVRGPKRLRRSPLTLTLMAMHRLSEICRYRPIQLASFLGGQKNWLLTEFISMSPPQFIDELAAELTGYQCMTPNVRPAT